MFQGHDVGTCYSHSSSCATCPLIYFFENVLWWGQTFVIHPVKRDFTFTKHWPYPKQDLLLLLVTVALEYQHWNKKAKCFFIFFFFCIVKKVTMTWLFKFYDVKFILFNCVKRWRNIPHHGSWLEFQGVGGWVLDCWHFFKVKLGN